MGLLDDWWGWRQGNASSLRDATRAGTDATMTALQGGLLDDAGRAALVNTPAAWLMTEPFRGGKAAGLLTPEARGEGVYKIAEAADRVAAAGDAAGQPQAARAVMLAQSNPITRKPVFELFDEAGNSLGQTRSHATEAEALAGYQRGLELQAQRAANPPAPAAAAPEPAPAVATPERNNWRMFRGEPQADDGYLYHVTDYPTARRILQQGLLPNSGAGMFQGGAYANYSKGKAFLTDPAGVGFWRDRIGAQLEHNYDRPPAVSVLRIPRDKTSGLLADEIGATDAGAPAYYSTKPVMMQAPGPFGLLAPQPDDKRKR